MSAYDTYALCPCGWYTRAPFGKLFHVHREVCPSCGGDKYRCSVVVARVQNYGFMGLRSRLVLREAEAVT